ncbi:hypothetical protein AGMMS49574_27700 [Bacteroidia bacterium]|nr:hypothetical protein AGMMS49574_27700 [Bacteroidia bacterium]
MQITNEILSNFLYCPYKAYRKSNLEKGTISEYQELYDNLKETYTRLFKKASADSIKFNVNFCNENINLTFDAIEYNEKNRIPIYFIPFEKVTKVDKLYVALQATFIQNYFHYKIDFCKIIFGKNLRQTKFKIPSYAKSAKKHSFDLDKILSNSNPPLFFKNQHCQICEFHDSCLKKLIERDDLSLLAGLKPKEIQQKNNRGFFSVRQLSYTFRPKKNPYRKRKFLPELKALAIRENKTFIQVMPTFPLSETQIYLDIEGLPDRNFYYLIGVIIKNQDTEKEYSFWANNEDEEIPIFIELITLITSYSNYTVYHYGSYEIQVLNSISKKLSSEYQNVVKNIIANTYNILSVFTNYIYPPTYSNSLKEIARFLKFEWTDSDSSGLQSTIWRYKWELFKDIVLKNKLLRYNIEDCKALINVKLWIDSLEDENTQQTSEIKQENIYKWGITNYIVNEFEEINKKAYFDYQREHIFLRTDKKVYRTISRAKVESEKYNKIDKKVNLFPEKCEKCKSKNIKIYR